MVPNKQCDSFVSAGAELTVEILLPAGYRPLSQTVSAPCRTRGVCVRAGARSGAALANASLGEWHRSSPVDRQRARTSLEPRHPTGQAHACH